MRGSIIIQIAALVFIFSIPISYMLAGETKDTERSKTMFHHSTRRPASGPLRIHPDNPRYFADGSGEAVYLTGSHTWAALHERRLEETPVFDYTAWLDFMEGHNHKCGLILLQGRILTRGRSQAGDKVNWTRLLTGTQFSMFRQSVIHRCENWRLSAGESV